MFFQGLSGQTGPIGIFAGVYDATTIYYLNSAGASIVSYAGEFWRTINAAKNGTNTWGTPMNGSADWQSIGAFFSAYTGNSYQAASNASGNTTITPASPNEVDAIAVTGGVSLRLFILSTVGRNEGDRAVLSFTLPATAGITINVRNASAVGTQLLPTSRFTSNTLTTDGVTLLLSLSFYFAGGAWNYLPPSL